MSKWSHTLSRFPNKALAKMTSELIRRPFALNYLLLVFLLLASLGSADPAAADDAQFWVSFDSDRSNPTPLDSHRVQGNAYIFLLSENAVKEVRFFIDDPVLSGEAKTIVGEPPYDLIANSSSTATPLDTTRLSDGAHVVSANLLLADESTSVVSASFAVSNMQAAIGVDTSSQPSMVFSRLPDRSGILQPLANAQIKGEIYPFMVSSKNIVRVQYSLDGGAHHTERLAPFDLKGGNMAKAKPFNTTFSGDGTHILNTKIDLAGGESTTLRIGFTIANSSLAEPSGFISPSVNILDFGKQQVGTTSSSKTIALTNTGYRAVDIEKIDISGDYNSSSNTCGTLEIGQNCSVSINFSPIQFETRNGILSIVSNAKNHQVMINLIGTSQRF